MNTTAIIAGIVCLVIGAAVASLLARMKGSSMLADAQAKVDEASAQAIRIEEEARRNAESAKKEAVLEAKEEILQLKQASEAEEKQRKSELRSLESRIMQREESLDHRNESLDKREHQLSSLQGQLDRQRADLNEVMERQTTELERISALTREDAHRELLDRVRQDTIKEEAQILRESDQRVRAEASKNAREILSLAIQRCAADHVGEITVTSVHIPSDDLKGRIIGREGRNIRSIETLTGVDLIIDDTPEAITVSSFDPVRREVARLALEKLIQDGRIHPARIEEMVEKAQREINATIKAEGERATFETGIHGLHPDFIKLLGRQKYRTSYGQNVLAHSIEVSHIAGLLAAELGVDVVTAKRAGLLHDIGKSIDHEVEGSHVSIGVELAKKYKESPDVIHAIEAHHGDVEARTVIACLVQAADTISAARPGARRENIENYVKRLEKLEEVSKSFPGIAGCYAIQAGREIRIMVKPEQVSEDEMVLLARDIAKKIENELTYPGQIKVHLLRETKAVEYAK